jgi:hypothetical protein
MNVGIFLFRVEFAFDRLIVMKKRSQLYSGYDVVLVLCLVVPTKQ